MRRPGREFGSEKPRVVYVALRWNDSRAVRHKEERLLNLVARKLGRQPRDLRIYNLCPPSKGRGMTLSMYEYPEVERTIRPIKGKIDRHKSVRLIVVGGRSGPMPLVALLLKLAVPAYESSFVIITEPGR